MLLNKGEMWNGGMSVLMLAMVSSIPTLAEQIPGAGSVDDEKGTLYTLCCCYQ